jgi:hypothetical protein
VVEHGEARRRREAVSSQAGLGGISVYDLDVVPASRSARAAVRSPSTSTTVSLGTCRWSRSVVCPGSGPTSSTSSPRSVAPSTQGSSSVSR